MRPIDLATIHNRIWFALDHGGHRAPGLQAAWNAHGAASYRFEELERIDPDQPLCPRQGAPDRSGQWRTELHAAAL